MAKVLDGLEPEDHPRRQPYKRLHTGRQADVRGTPVTSSGCHLRHVVSSPSPLVVGLCPCSRPCSLGLEASGLAAACATEVAPDGNAAKLKFLSRAEKMFRSTARLPF